MESGAYGASLAGGDFDCVNFVKQPQTIVRLLSWIFSIVVFATITAEGYINKAMDEPTKCMFNQTESACSYGVGIGVLAFLACVVFIILDAYFPQISNAKDRKYIVTADLVFSGVWTFLWFVCFCVLTSEWSHTKDTTNIPVDAAQAVVAFSFFSIVTWAVLTTLAFRRYRQGVNDLDQGYADPATDHNTYPPTYPPYPSSGPEGYQQSPFTHSQGQPGEYKPPAY